MSDNPYEELSPEWLLWEIFSGGETTDD
ncbi:hypothetical protein PROPHIT493_51 [Mycobacterium phage prophiT49-3]|nr:hypothetical protein PROPHIT493_51 [Mycobacterium phage prophiT49-3]